MELSSMHHELMLALRSLRRRPAFAAAAVATLALGIGPNTAIFSVVDALLLRPLPFPHAEQLVRLESVRGGEAGSLSYREVLDMRELRDVFVDVAKYTDQGQYNASGDGRPEEMVSTITTRNLFQVLRVPLLFGAVWPEALDHTRDFKLVISYDLWQRRFGGDRNVLGKTLTLDGAPGYLILGVLPRGFAFPVRSDLYRSHGIAPSAASYADRAARGGWGIARLRAGVSVERARAALAELASRLERDYPASNAGVGYRATPLRDVYVGETRAYLLLVFGAASLVLLIACANVANLLLSRVLGREREIGVRVALGASAGDVVRLLLVESVVLAAVAGVVGVLLAVGALRGLLALIHADLPAWLGVGLSWRVLGFTAVASLCTGVFTGLIPALRLGRGDLAGALKDGGRGASGGVRQRRVRTALVVSQLALATMLLIDAGLLVRSFRSLLRLSPGFDADSTLTFRVELGWRAYPDLAASARFEREMLRQLAELPGVETAAMISNLPLGGRPKTDDVVMLEGQSAIDQRTNPYINLRVASPTVFRAMRIPLIRGRSLARDDRDSMPPVAVVSRAAAARLWPGLDPVGRRILIGSLDSTRVAWRTVVGEVGDVRHESVVAAPSLDVYVPYEQWHANGNYFLLRTRGDPLALARKAPELAWAIDPNQSFFDVRTMRSRVADRIWIPRLAGFVFSAFGALAALLAGVGVFALLSTSVAQRTRELGVRQALGASSGDLVRQIVAEGMRWAVLGAAAGLAGAIGLARTFEHLLHDVTAFDLPTLVAVPIVLVVVAGVACWLPARHAGRISPLEALRADGA